MGGARALALALRATGAQSGSGQIRGVVTDGANPVAGAEVKIASGVVFARTTRTDAAGQFQFTDPEAATNQQRFYRVHAP